MAKIMNSSTKTAIADDSARDLILHEFIPYACHYSADTLLTKNGELIQFIKLSDSGGDNDHEFRENLRAAVNDAIDPAKFSVWIHTVRSKSEIKSFEEGGYAQYVDHIWREQLPSAIHYNNEIYISVIIDSAQFEPWKMKSYIRSLSKRKEEAYRIEQLEEKYKLLNKTADQIIEKLSLYNSEKLGIYAYDESYNSEIMEFARTLMGLNYGRMPLPLKDLSLSIKPEHLEFNTYSGIISINDSATATNKYGAVISIKECVGITAPALQDLLNADAEFIISQSIDFAFGNRFLPAIKDQAYYTKVSLDKHFLGSINLQNANTENADNFVLQQTNLTIIKPTIAQLNQSIEAVQKNLQKLGVVAYLEDINSERAYWSNLSGAFSFLKRQSSMVRSNIGNFACFGVDKYTSIEDCLFGKPIMFFQTQEKDIFALHFLSNGQGHILIAGSNENERHMLAGLIATEAAHAGAEIIFYDHFAKYHNFAQSLNATYLNNIDLDHIASLLENDNVKIIMLNSLKPVLENNGHKAFSKFLEYAGSKNCIIICSADQNDNCELLLQDFTTTIFFPTEKVTERYADNFDIFEDEIQVIQQINKGYIYARHGYEELTLKFDPSEKLKTALLEGKF